MAPKVRPRLRAAHEHQPTMPNASLEPRVAHLEADMSSLAATVDRLASTVERVNANLSSAIERSEANLREDIRGMSADANRRAAEDAKSRSTNWGWIIAGIVATSVIVGAIGKGYVDPVTIRQAATDRQAEENADDLRDLWHKTIPELRESNARMDERLKALEARR